MICAKPGSHTNISGDGKLTTKGSKDSILVKVVFQKLRYDPALITFTAWCFELWNDTDNYNKVNYSLSPSKPFINLIQVDSMFYLLLQAK